MVLGNLFLFEPEFRMSKSGKSRWIFQNLASHPERSRSSGLIKETRPWKNMFFEKSAMTFSHYLGVSWGDKIITSSSPFHIN